MLEESTVWVLRYGRFIEAAGWADTVQLCRAVLPAPVRAFMPALIRRGMRRALASQGMGRYPAAQIWDFGRRDLDCLVGVLGDHPFLLGDRPHVVDAAVFGLVGNLACEHARSPMADLVQARPSLVAYVERMRERCFPELPSWIGMRRDGAVAIAA
jgi:glutathione S-transferase